MSIFEILFVVILIFSLISNFLSIPGNFVIVLNAMWYGLVTGFTKYSFSFVIMLILIATLVELLEYVLIILGARRYGASRWGVVGAVLGGIIGSISGAFFSPIIGAIIGGFIGVVMGTLLVELVIKRRNFLEAKQAMLGALIGRVGALTIKAIGTVTMVVIVSYKMFF